MPDFFAILAFYYACDSAAMSGALTREQITYCSHAYEQVKTHFLSEEELAALEGLTIAERSVRVRKGYLRFKRWEEANPDIVASLKNRALGEVV